MVRVAITSILGIMIFCWLILVAHQQKTGTLATTAKRPQIKLKHWLCPRK